ncbi:hypothetical protein [Pontibacter liquoris]|uniref:hypothetical protein n=1 Tax=Pontibacter liquoris TaxID=2905677 RepID=UPI001FA748F2|nr:hypothetical protein [Pontibacter liquoris]
MNTKPLRFRLKQLWLPVGSPLIAVMAIGCALLVETRPVDYTQTLELVLKGIVNDSILLTIPTK